MLKKRVKGNTIIEVLIALAIISFCIALASIIYLNIQKSSLPFFKLKAVDLTEKYMHDSIEKKNYVDETFKQEEFTVKKVIRPHDMLSDCILIRILVFDGSQKKIHELETIVFNQY